MDTGNKIIPEDAKYLARRVLSYDVYRLYLWGKSFYEVISDWGSDEIREIKPVNYKSILDLYIETMHHTGKPEPCFYDRIEGLTETSRIISEILQADHPDFYEQLLWDEKLHWYCEMIEVRAAYLVDDILTDDITVTDARDIAIRQLLQGNLERHIKEPYTKRFKSDRAIYFPEWFYRRRNEQNLLIENHCTFGYGIRDVIDRLYGYGGWEDATAQDYWDSE